MIDSPEGAPLKGRWSVYTSYALALGMMVCFAITSILLARRLFADWDSRGLLAACTLAAIEAILSYWLLKHLAIAQRQPIFFRFSEWLIFAAAIKVFTELQGGPSQLVGNILVWPVNFPFNFFTGAYLLNFLLIFMTWRASTFFAADLYLLEVDEAARTDERVVATPIRNLILRRFLWVGLLVAFIAGALLGNETGPDLVYWSGKVVPAVLVFFILGLGLVSLTRFANLESGWRQDGVEVPAQIPRRWVFYSLLIIALLVVLAVWLPTDYGFGLSAIITAILRFLYGLVYSIYGLILFFYTLILQVFARASGPPEDGTIPPEPILPPQLGPPPTPLFDPELVKAVIVWTVLGGLAIILLRQYISFNRDLAEELRRFRPLRWLAAFWKSLKVSMKKVNHAVGSFVANGLERLRAGRSGRADGSDWDTIRPRRLNPRQRIFFYYLALVRRGADTGVQRREGETPYEYARSLSAGLEEGKDDVETMTASFVEARYSNHDIASKAAHQVESVWGHIRRILLEKKKRRSGEPPGRNG